MGWKIWKVHKRNFTGLHLHSGGGADLADLFVKKLQCSVLALSWFHGLNQVLTWPENKTLRSQPLHRKAKKSCTRLTVEIQNWLQCRCIHLVPLNNGYGWACIPPYESVIPFSERLQQLQKKNSSTRVRNDSLLPGTSTFHCIPVHRLRRKYAFERSVAV